MNPFDPDWFWLGVLACPFMLAGVIAISAGIAWLQDKSRESRTVARNRKWLEEHDEARAAMEDHLYDLGVDDPAGASKILADRGWRK